MIMTDACSVLIVEKSAIKLPAETNHTRQDQLPAYNCPAPGTTSDINIAVHLSFTGICFIG